MKFWDYGKHDLDGYQQSGDIHGKYFGTWLRQLDDGKVIIVSFGDEIKRYWLQMGNCFHGNYATPERAALEAEKLLSANVEFSERSAAGAKSAGNAAHAARKSAMARRRCRATCFCLPTHSSGARAWRASRLSDGLEGGDSSEK